MHSGDILHFLLCIAFKATSGAHAGTEGAVGWYSTAI